MSFFGVFVMNLQPFLLRFDCSRTTKLNKYFGINDILWDLGSCGVKLQIFNFLLFRFIVHSENWKLYQNITFSRLFISSRATPCCEKKTVRRIPKVVAEIQFR